MTTEQLSSLLSILRERLKKKIIFVDKMITFFKFTRFEILT